MSRERAKLGSKRRPDLSGSKFGRLTVSGVGPMKGKRQSWLCVCDCGQASTATTSDLRYGSVQSCGCLLKGPTAANTKHYHQPREVGPSRTYNSWRGMIERCSNEDHISYENYGGRGISVCKEWKEFDKFIADMGERPVGMTIDRIDTDGNYEPTNCKWSNNIEQRHNRRDSKLTV